MWKYTVQVDGMMCGMCEAHMNDTIRRNFDIKKVSSSHSKNECVFTIEEEIDEAKLKEAIDSIGYDMGKVTKEPYKKKGLFGF